MIRLTIFLGGGIWAAMFVAPALQEPVFTEKVAVVTAPAEPTPVIVVAQTAPVIERVTVIAPAVTPTQVSAPAQPTPEPDAIVERTIWYVTGSRVNVRSGPSTRFEVMGQVVYGEAAEIISDPNETWVKIRIEGDGVEGYISKKFMTQVDPFAG